MELSVSSVNPTPTNPQGKLHALTALRFFAAGMIVLHHSRSLFGISSSFGESVNLASGVSFFFVLSGFILTYVYPSLERTGIRRFWLARFARIWPAHVASLLLLLLLVPPARPRLDSDSLGPLAANLALVHSWIPLGRYYFSYNHVSWSVATEVGFYLCFPLLIANWPRTWWWKLGLALLGSGGMIVLTNVLTLPYLDIAGDGVDVNGTVYVNPVAHLFEFVLGMATALAWRRVSPSIRLSRWTATAIEMAVLGVVVVLLFYSLAWADELGRYPWVGLGGQTWLWSGGIPCLGFAALIFVLATGQGLVARILTIPPLLLLGEIKLLDLSRPPDLVPLL